MPRRGLALRSRSYLSTSASAPAPCSGSRLRWRWHVTGLRRAARDAPIFSVVRSKSRDWHHHDCSGAKPLLMDCNRGGWPDLGGTSIRSIKRSSRSNLQSRSSAGRLTSSASTRPAPAGEKSRTLHSTRGFPVRQITPCVTILCRGLIRRSTPRYI
jgi:hypothetical protein